MLSPFECLCGNFILTEPASYVFFYAIFNLRKLLYIILTIEKCYNINLTFCCQQATVITDFSDLSAVGRNHYMNLHGGSAKTDELKALDGEAVARSLIAGGGGTVTPYGVVYDNGMKLEQV